MNDSRTNAISNFQSQAPLHRREVGGDVKRLRNMRMFYYL